MDDLGGHLTGNDPAEHTVRTLSHTFILP
jgi:hypothetical protein